MRTLSFASSALFVMSFVATEVRSATVVLNPSDNIQTKVNANPGTTTFVFSAGVYRLQAISPKSGNVFDGQGAATLNGSKILSGFTKSGNTWVVTNQSQHGQVNNGADCQDLFPRCNRPEDLFIDNVPQKHVSNLRLVKPGTWFFDYNAKKIYIGDNPTGHTVETSVTAKAITAEVDNVTVKNLTIEKYATPLQFAAVGSQEGSNWIITGNTIRLNHASGVGISPTSQITRNKILQNGQEGFAGGGASFLFEANEVGNNNFAGVNHDWEAGGGKITETTGGVVRGNCVHDNDGPGIWMDERGDGVTVENNIVWNNSANGIMYEISYNGVIRNNTVADNGSVDTVEKGWFWAPQILVSSANGVQVYGNTVDVPATYGNAITIISQGRRPYTPAINNIIYGNTVTIRGNNWGRLGAVTDVDADSATVAAKNSMHDNHYHLVTTSNDYWGWKDIDRTFTGVKRVGQESGSTMDGVLPIKPELSCSFLQ